MGYHGWGAYFFLTSSCQLLDRHDKGHIMSSVSSQQNILCFYIRICHMKEMQKFILCGVKNWRSMQLDCIFDQSQFNDSQCWIIALPVFWFLGYSQLVSLDKLLFYCITQVLTKAITCLRMRLLLHVNPHENIMETLYYFYHWWSKTYFIEWHSRDPVALHDIHSYSYSLVFMGKGPAQTNRPTPILFHKH